MVNGLTPNYRNNLVPHMIGNSCSYNLRNLNNLRNIACRTCLYNSSFLPTVIIDWNSLPDDIKNAESLPNFVRGDFTFMAIRKIMHARLRNRCSSLNDHLYLKNVVDSPLCRCGAVESTKHFIFWNVHSIITREMI